MYEYEIKLPITAPEDLAARLAALGFEKAGTIREEDSYYNHPERDLKQAGLALRLRKSTDLADSRLTATLNFKGQRMDSRTMSRPEYETVVADPAAAAGILTGLGYVLAAPVIKERQYFRKAAVTACIDTVEGLGTYLELEILSETAQAHDACLARLDDLLRELRLSPEDTVTLSYLDLLEY